MNLNKQKLQLFQKKFKGFTLIEILVAIAIIAVLSVIGLTVFSQAQKSARDTKRIQDIQAIGSAYEVHYDGLTSSYMPLAINQFAGGNIPLSTNGISYNFISGPNAATPQGVACGAVKICAPLEGGAPNCSDSSPNCFCYTGLQGDKGCLASIPPPAPPGPPPSPPGPPPPGPPPPAPGPPAPVPPGPPGPPAPIPPPGPPPPGPPAPPSLVKRVFVTSNAYDGNMGGLSGANSRCQSSANSAGLGGSWRAWLSNSFGSPLTTFNSSSDYRTNTVFSLLNNAVVANNWADLTDGALQNAIFINENGNPEPTSAWTNTLTSGAIDHVNPHIGSCNQWTNNSSAFGAYGSSGSAGISWTQDRTTTCVDAKNLYCFEQ